MLLHTMVKFEIDLDYATTWTTILIALVALIFIFWDVHYFIRTAFVVIWGKVFEDKLKPEDTSTVYGVCLTTDLDIMFRHMNNARYVRELDFGRFHFYDRTGIYNVIMAANGNILQSASTIRYRRSIPLFMTYKITTKLIYWDEKSIYIEQQFISLKDGFVRAVALSKQGTVGINVPEVLAKMLNKEVSYRPALSPELEHFMNCLEASSVRLRKKEE